MAPRIERHQEDEDIDVSPEMLRAREDGGRRPRGGEGEGDEMRDQMARVLGHHFSFLFCFWVLNELGCLRVGLFNHSFLRDKEEEVALAVLRLLTVPALHRLSCLQGVLGNPESWFLCLHCGILSRQKRTSQGLAANIQHIRGGWSSRIPAAATYQDSGYFNQSCSTNSQKTHAIATQHSTGYCIWDWFSGWPPRHRVLRNILADPESSRVRQD